MAVIKFEANGQGFYDFDLLLSVTNKEFVELIEYKINHYSSEKNRDSFKLLSVKYDLAEKKGEMTTVILNLKSWIYIFKFIGTGVIHQMMIGKYQLPLLVGEYGE